MSRSGYSDSCDGWDLIRWRGAVSSAIRGKRGQAFLREMLEALDALPEKKLIESALVTPDGCCALGTVALKRGIDVSGVDVYDREVVAQKFGIAEAMAAEIMHENDEGCPYWHHRDNGAADAKRFERVRAWVVENLDTSAGCGS